MINGCYCLIVLENDGSNKWKTKFYWYQREKKSTGLKSCSLHNRNSTKNYKKTHI